MQILRLGLGLGRGRPGRPGLPLADVQPSHLRHPVVQQAQFGGHLLAQLVDEGLRVEWLAQLAVVLLRRGEQARPPVWVLEPGLSRNNLPVAVHVGGCHMAGERWKGVPRDVALRALAEGVDACEHCRPGTVRRSSQHAGQCQAESGGLAAGTTVGGR
ncbi:DUF6233 domain-containing protein [Streptomyces sp. NPDC014864]|uniref:DUF6233 domain-containing protein n=1 Tax=Streptomyces sp. NPDC014864 TaxID=3364924 RepID=UPI0036F627E7